jgi:hypothetical protein
MQNEQPKNGPCYGRSTSNCKRQTAMTNQTARGKRQTATPRVGTIAVSLFRRLISHCRLLFAFSMLVALEYG